MMTVKITVTVNDDSNDDGNDDDIGTSLSIPFILSPREYDFWIQRLEISLDVQGLIKIY